LDESDGAACVTTVNGSPPRTAPRDPYDTLVVYVVALELDDAFVPDAMFVLDGVGVGRSFACTPSLTWL
jgi:hypothetical protein